MSRQLCSAAPCSHLPDPKEKRIIWQQLQVTVLRSMVRSPESCVSLPYFPLHEACHHAAACTLDAACDHCFFESATVASGCRFTPRPLSPPLRPPQHSMHKDDITYVVPVNPHPGSDFLLVAFYIEPYALISSGTAPHNILCLAAPQTMGSPNPGIADGDGPLHK